jgi:hypothetical protein
LSGQESVKFGYGWAANLRLEEKQHPVDSDASYEASPLINPRLRNAKGQMKAKDQTCTETNLA